ncbi:MAG: ABC transporter ATP-binding protein [Candidatus Margulisbacteria bacterium]|nr:ABC transporter ATP-binding protein [Candidatus Margulisiibacteriota bacterium]
MILLKKLTKKFGDKVILSSVDLEISSGETLAVIGPSGCGKSTLLRLILRLETPTEGSIQVDDVDIEKIDEDGLNSYRQKIGMVFQSAALFDSMTVFENVAFGLRERNELPESKIKDIVKEKLQFVELEGSEELMPSELSGGMQKRVSIARALATEPQIILYDEPTTGLDPITSTTIEDLINKLSKSASVTSIVVTHQLTTIFRTAHRIIMLDKGKFIECGDVEQTKKSRDPIVHKFITAGLD